MVRILSTFVGSYPRPSWFNTNLGSRDFLDAMYDSVYREQYLDAVSSVMRDQERVGLDLLSDGEMRNDLEVGGRTWFFYALDRLSGLEYSSLSEAEGTTVQRNSLPEGTILHEVFNAYRIPIIRDKVRKRVPLRYSDIWKAAQERTNKPVKFAANSIHNYVGMCDNRYYKNEEDLLMDFAKINNGELRELVKSGCKHIQIDEPVLHVLPIGRKVDSDRMELWKDAYNKEVEGLSAEIWAHTCWGNPNQQSAFPENPSYLESLPHFLEIKADVLTFEMASSDGKDLHIFKEYPTDKKIAIGVINHVNNQVETPEKIADLLVKAAKYIDPDKLIATSDCGFGREGMSRRIVFYKLKALVEGAKLASKRLS